MARDLEHLPTEDVLLPAIAALYLSSSAESEYGSATEQEGDREWREAVRAALEEDLQRQVRLRLGLTSPMTSDGHLSPPHPHTPLPSLVHHRHSTHHPSLPHLHPTLPHLHPSLPHRANEQSHDSVEQRGERTEERRLKRREGRRREEDRGKGAEESQKDERRSKPSAGSVKMDVYQYLSRKYGTPAEQLSHLVAAGSFRTSRRNDGGYCVHAPVEANILLPTPRHIRPVKPVEEFVKPVRSERDSQHQPSLPLSPEEYVPFSRGKKVYDSSCTELNGETHGGGQTLADRHGRLKFESRFESGNLHHAVEVGQFEYRLVLQTDLYSRGHTQWFYFQLTGMAAGQTYTFHIINFMKKDSLYNYGMQPLLYSEAEAGSGRGWRRVGRDISYYRQGEHYTLTWRMEFPHSRDTCYLAHCYPYTYTHLLHYLDTVERERGCHIRREVMCNTLAGNPCYLLTIADFDATPEVWSSRGGVVITARVHPGETNSSWMMEGVIDFLTSETPHAKVVRSICTYDTVPQSVRAGQYISLRSNYVFKVIPMLNPDGVIVGNYRTSLAGVDLNRVYKRPIENLFPTIYHTKSMVAAFMEERELMLYVDLHGHSRKHNVFTYGCHVPQCDHTHFLNERVIPFLLSQQAPDKFSFGSCKFNVHRCKEATGRVVTWRMGVANSFTLEATFCGSTLGNGSHQFTEMDLLTVGNDLCEAIHRYYKLKTSKSYQQKILAQLAELIMMRLKRDKAPQPSTPPSVPLPDIVTSSTPHTVTAAPSHPPKPHHHAKRNRSRHTKILQRFAKIDLALLESESSTSGSDSDNDEFEFHKKAHASKHRHRRKHRSIPPQHTTQPPQPPPPPPSQSSSLPTHAPHTRRLLPKLHASAPARMQATSSITLSKKVMPSGYRFVNRYANRSNGGIPMFSEERLRERTEKRLRSLSMIQAPTQPRPPDVMPHPHPTARLPLPTHLFLWRPDDSQEESRQMTVSLRQRPSHPPPPSLPSSLHHYHTIKTLVEHRRTQVPRQLGGALAASGHAHWPHPLPQTEGSQLSKYISEMWNR